MDAAYFEADLKQVGREMRQKYEELVHGVVRVVLQIDSAGGHGMARGDGVLFLFFDGLAAIMDKGFNVELVRQPGNTPMYNILDLNIWQATQLEVDKMNKDQRHREPELVKVCQSRGRNFHSSKFFRPSKCARTVPRKPLKPMAGAPVKEKGEEAQSGSTQYRHTPNSENA